MTDSQLHQRLDPRGKRSFIIFCLVACAIFAVSMVYQYRMIQGARRQTIGDGLHVASYQFDLSNLNVPRDLLVASGLPRDGQEAMNDPKFDDITVIDQLAKNPWRAVVVSDDAVIGVSINGDDRAYPIRYVNWHEIINDTVGGVPIAVTFSPISRSAVVFDRRVNGQTLRFGYSGLIYNNNLVMYGMAETRWLLEKPTLWSQLKFEAIAGPMAGTKLTVLQCRLTRWADWKAAHPTTKVLQGDPNMKRKYKRKPYPDKVESGRPVFALRPVAPSEEKVDGVMLQPADMVAGYLDAAGKWHLVPDVMDHQDKLPADAPVAYARWFAWYAFHFASSQQQ